MEYMLKKGNRELAADGIFSWSIPALNTRLSSGANFITCPNAGICANLCYARSGTYNFSNVKAAHTRNLELVLSDPEGWEARLNAELQAKRYRDGKAVRIHDAGDFFAEWYFEIWYRAALSAPDVLFYAYTKEVEMTKKYDLPENFVLIYSMGGKQDHLVDKERDRHADVFPTLEMLEAAGYSDQEESDLLAATLPTNKIGIVVNNIPHLKKKQGAETFSGLQDKRIEKIRRAGQ